MDANLVTYALLSINAALLLGIIFWGARRQDSSEKKPSDSVRDDFLAMISHEIRTPLNGIIGFADVLARSRLDEIQLDSVKNIQESGRGLLRILNDILDMSKARAGKLQLVEEAVDVRAIVRSVFDLFRPLYQKNHNKVSLRIAEDVPETVLSDEIRLRQILSNLLSNAAKFTQNGFITCDVSKDDTHLIFIVADTGIGIDPARQAAIFEPFEQESQDTSRQYGGTGLGLSIVRHIIDLMGGDLALVSEPGKGSHFTVRIPLKHAPEESASGMETESDAPFFHHHILVVEDIPMNQNLTRALLEKRGCTVVIAVHGAEALDLLADQVFDTVLMDVRMPVMDGLEATRKIREKFSSHLLPIIGMTAHADSSEIKNCLEAGMDEVVTKPVKSEELYKVLADWLYRDDDSFAVPLDDHEATKHQDLTSFDILNTAMIDQFVEFLGEDGLRSAINDTEVDIHERLEKLKEQDYEPILLQNEMHAIASIVGNIGLNRLSMLCRRMMHDANTNVFNADREKQIQDFQELWQHSRETLDYYLTRK
jgi:CheY-like chemotaxis protein